MIVVENLVKTFGGFHAVDGASLRIEEGTITGLIGPNGAGKTTLFNVIAGVLKPTEGRVTMLGKDITGLPPHELFHKGLLRTFQIAHAGIPDNRPPQGRKSRQLVRWTEKAAGTGAHHDGRRQDCVLG